MADWHVGQMVVCIGDFTPRHECESNVPVKGGVYTVREIDVGDSGKVGLRLEEMVNRPFQYSNGFAECSFTSTLFRPVRETDISVFTAMLNKVPDRVDA